VTVGVSGGGERQNNEGTAIKKIRLQVYASTSGEEEREGEKIVGIVKPKKKGQEKPRMRLGGKAYYL